MSIVGDVLGFVGGRGAAKHGRWVDRQMVEMGWHDHQHKVNMDLLDADWRWRDRADQMYLAHQGAGIQMQDMIDTGRANGIHPLAALGATASGYQAVPTSPIGASSSAGSPPGAGAQNPNVFLGSAMDKAGEILTGQRRMDNQLKQAQIELMKAQSRSLIQEVQRPDYLGAERTGSVEQEKEMAAANQRTADGQVKPKQAPWKERITVRLPNGAKALIPANIARNFGLKEMEYMTAGQIAELTGEVWGEGSNFINIKPILENMGISVIGDRKTRSKGTQGSSSRKRARFSTQRPKGY